MITIDRTMGFRGLRRMLIDNAIASDLETYAYDRTVDWEVPRGAIILLCYVNL